MSLPTLPGRPSLPGKPKAPPPVAAKPAAVEQKAPPAKAAPKAVAKPASPPPKAAKVAPALLPTETPEGKKAMEAAKVVIRKAESAARISRLMDALSGAHGEDVHLGNDIVVQLPGVIPTNIATVDAATGRGGMPMGRLIVVTGQEAGGKTTFCLELCARVQEMGGIANYIDKESKLDTDYAATLGVNIDELVISRPPTGERVFQYMADVVAKTEPLRYVGGAKCPQCGEGGEKKNRRTSCPDCGFEVEDEIPVLIVLDSINATMPAAVVEGEWDDQFMGAQARMFSQNLPKFLPLITHRKVCLVFISQVREKLGGQHGSTKEKVSGGNAAKFYAAMVMEIWRKEWLKSGDREIGTTAEAKFIKNQVAPPMKKALYDLIWGVGIDKMGAMMERAVEIGIMNSGSAGWYEMPQPDGYTFKDKKPGEVLKWQGPAGFKKALEKWPHLLGIIQEQVDAKCPR